MGSDLGIGVGLVYDSKSDEKKFIEIRKEIEKYVQSGKPITKAIIDRYIEEKVISRLSDNPRAVRALTARIRSALDQQEFNLPEGPTISDNLTEFVEGLLESLEIMYPDNEEVAD